MAERTTCEDRREELAEVALGVLDPAEVPGLEAHLAGCPVCRAELVELAATADRLVLLAPSVEPPAGFEQRAVAAMGAPGRSGSAAPADPPPPRRRAAAAAAVAIAAVVAAVVVGLGLLVRDDGPGGPAEVAAPLVADDGRAVGRVAVRADPPRSMTVSLDGLETGVRYRCDVVLADGTRREVGTWTVWGEDDSWTVPVPDGPADRVELTRVGGGTAATAVLDD
ncbi:anti-sigma factor family protein [Dermatobacter hominis]|uniref:anti-sigma factor family protein n=1 Tax=Dermatobacter hominis TaxID=2884263 RepID=UPI001D10572F|nr:zf-HC2 domain-containing protein [Dermatobacter hominis]UDY36314.1 zf-HC2 domain-containing protein [Dermatobacter hominis]